MTSPDCHIPTTTTPRTDAKAIECAKMKDADAAYWAMFEHSASLELEAQQQAKRIQELEEMLYRFIVQLKVAGYELHADENWFDTSKAVALLNRPQS